MFFKRAVGTAVLFLTLGTLPTPSKALGCIMALYDYTVLETHLECQPDCLDPTSYDVNGRRKCAKDYLQRLCGDGTFEPHNMCDPLVMVAKAQHHSCNLTYGKPVPWIFETAYAYTPRHSNRKDDDGQRKQTFMMVYDDYSDPNQFCAKMIVQILDRDSLARNTLNQEDHQFFKEVTAISDPLEISFLETDTPLEVGKVIQLTRRIPMKLKCGANYPVMKVKFAVLFLEVRLTNGAKLCSWIYNCRSGSYKMVHRFRAKQTAELEAIKVPQTNALLGLKCKCCPAKEGITGTILEIHKPYYYLGKPSGPLHPELGRQWMHDTKKCGRLSPRFSELFKQGISGS